MWYELDTYKLSKLLTPTFLRSAKMLAWLRSITAPFDSGNQAIVYQFQQNRESNLYKLRHNGQVCYLRAALNDRFDPSERRIYIDDGNSYKRVYLYTRAEDKPKHLYTRGEKKPMYLYERTDYSDTGVDFIVFVPSDLTYNDYEMKALIDFYKLASKRYKIVKFNA